MTLNLCNEGPARGKAGAMRWAALIRESKAQIVGLQEISDPNNSQTLDTLDSSSNFSLIHLIARALDWNVFSVDKEAATGVITCFTLADQRILLPNDKLVNVISIHLPDSPYQIAQLTGVDYKDGAPPLHTEKEAVQSACKLRCVTIQTLLNSLDSENTIVMGDFNEASHLDWTNEAESKSLVPLAVRWPITRLFEKHGFYDVFRQNHPDATKTLGYTYPAPAWKEFFGMPARIDYIFSSSPNVVYAKVFYDKKSWPSDHCGVIGDIYF
jgi:endonuclease/exonuclease/phosphatase family metal-dependent hydrolase